MQSLMREDGCAESDAQGLTSKDLCAQTDSDPQRLIRKDSLGANTAPQISMFALLALAYSGLAIKDFCQRLVNCFF